MLFAPRRAAYTALVGGVPAFTESRPTAAASPTTAVQFFTHDAQLHLLTGDGVAVRVSHQDETFGVLEIEGVAFSEYAERYLSFALTLGKVCGIAVANARKYDRVRQAEQALAMEMLRIANESAVGPFWSQ